MKSIAPTKSIASMNSKPIRQRRACQNCVDTT
jgi:hypothetical protein